MLNYFKQSLKITLLLPFFLLRWVLTLIILSGILLIGSITWAISIRDLFKKEIE